MINVAFPDRCSLFAPGSFFQGLIRWRLLKRFEQNVDPQYSIVIPAYNESARIGRALTEVLRTLDEKAWNAEVLVVNDGSTDSTASIIESFAAKDHRVRLLQNGTNRGKGYSVR